VLVTKNPCSHPGDIQKVKAVSKKELEHLYNVVVYSSKGERPQQHKLSMGDLDGDTYFVTWDEEIVNAFGENYPPGKNAKQQGKEFVNADPAEHIVNYLKKDNLGKLCDLHMALCDRLGPEGPKDKEL